MKLLLTWGLAACALLLVAYVYPGVQVVSFSSALIAAAVIGLFNMLLRPVLVVLTLPVTVVTLGPKGEWQTELRRLQPLRDMRRIRGELAKLLEPAVYQAANREDYLHVSLTDEGELWEPANQLRAVYPNFMSLELAGRDKAAATGKNAAAAGYKTKSKLEQFGEFYAAISGGEFDAAKQALLQEVLQEIEHSERSA